MTQLIRMKELQKIVVPKLEYVNLRDEYKTACKFIDGLDEYFPDYKDSEEGYAPPREYFWNVAFTKDSGYVEKKVSFLVRWS